MTEDLRCTYIFRTESVLKDLRNFNSGMDAHRVGNLRNVANGLLDLLNQGDTDPVLSELLTSLEKKHLEFIKWKFQHSY